MIKLQFTHIPKNGGTSVKRLKANEIKCLTHYEVSNPSVSPSFLILRDPITRFQSAYSMRQSDPASSSLVRRWLQSMNLKNINDYVDWKISSPSDYDPIQNDVNLVNNRVCGLRLSNNLFFEFQSTWHGLDMPNHVIIFESMTSELEILFERYSIGITKVSHSNKRRMPDENLKLNQATVNYIEKKYKKDFDLWTKYKSIDINTRAK